jgi:DNA end-binding protein Ku
MKALWKGSISFGLVNIPVKLYSASQSHTLDLDMLRKGDLCQVRFMRVCREDGKEIPYEDIVRGYKYKNGDYVVLTDKDFESANVEKTHTIDILHFVNEKEVDSVYFEKPYYLEPEKSGTKSYALLREAIKQTKKVGLGRLVLKNREHVGLIRLYKDVIVFNQIRYADEIRSTSELTIPAATSITKKEVDMAVALVKQLSKKFNPREYKDTYVDELKQIIDKKAKGQKIKPKGHAHKPSAAGNLMKLLKQSMKNRAA